MPVKPSAEQLPRIETGLLSIAGANATAFTGTEIRSGSLRIVGATLPEGTEGLPTETDSEPADSPEKKRAPFRGDVCEECVVTSAAVFSQMQKARRGRQRAAREGGRPKPRTRPRSCESATNASWTILKRSGIGCLARS
jgi:hypothetical protein